MKAGAVACLLVASCTNVNPGSAPTIELDKRYETQAAPTAHTYARYLPVHQRAVLVTLAAKSDPRYVKGQCRENGVPLSEQPGSI